MQLITIINYFSVNIKHEILIWVEIFY